MDQTQEIRVKLIGGPHGPAFRRVKRLEATRIVLRGYEHDNAEIVVGWNGLVVAGIDRAKRMAMASADLGKLRALMRAP